MGSTIKEQYYFNRCEKDSHYEEGSCYTDIG